MGLQELRLAQPSASWGCLGRKKIQDISSITWRKTSCRVNGNHDKCADAKFSSEVTSRWKQSAPWVLGSQLPPATPREALSPLEGGGLGQTTVVCSSAHCGAEGRGIREGCAQSAGVLCKRRWETRPRHSGTEPSASCSPGQCNVVPKSPSGISSVSKLGWAWHLGPSGTIFPLTTDLLGDRKWLALGWQLRATQSEATWPTSQAPATDGTQCLDSLIKVDGSKADSLALTLKLVKEAQLPLGTNYTNYNNKNKWNPTYGSDEMPGRNTANPSGDQAPQCAEHLCFLALLHHSNPARGRTRAHGLTLGLLGSWKPLPMPPTPSWPTVQETSSCEQVPSKFRHGVSWARSPGSRNSTLPPAQCLWEEIT